jgi:hypothetical protein
MGLTYLDCIDHLYGTSEFTVRDFAIRVGNPRTGKLVSDLKRRGHLIRVGRGRYRRLSPGERPDLRRFEWERARRMLLDGPGGKAWAGETAVEVWTNGRYRASPSVFTRVYTLAVPKRSLGLWRNYLRKHGISAVGRKRIGVHVELLPTERMRATLVRGEPVITRREVVNLIRAHPGIYANAEDLIVERR